MTKVYVRHIREAGYCVTGLRLWCKERGFNFKNFIRSGIDAEELERLDDHMVRTVIQKAKEEERGR